MRLLHFDQTRRLILTDFSGRTTPPYAILSHRWNSDTDSEVLFEDLGNDTWERKAGYPKIEFCAKQAAQDGLQYFWVDTCCIDKWNRPERSKAVNSMYRWYQNSAKCYVFLPDVSTSTMKVAQQQSTHKASFRSLKQISRKVFSGKSGSRSTAARQLDAWEETFRASEWFTRGWTLQELIAPASVEFFSSDGQRLGDKESLKQLIHDITSIPVKALQGRPLQNFSISDRMAWAESRRTTEPEDGAYCQLGILNINMPLSYGEGKAKALRRLREELQATSATPSIIPFSRNDQFVGHESLLAELEAKLFTSKQTTKIAITGEGGTGKSQLALELAYRTRQENKSCSVFWIDASDVDSLHQAYSSIAQKLDIPGWDDEKADTKQLVKMHLSRKSAKHWLLVLDGADDISLGSSLGSAGLSSPHPANLIDYLPQSELGSIIFTTTDRVAAKTLASQNIIELREMTPDTAQTMLENYLTNPVLTSEKEERELLLKELSYLPLAIIQAAAYINIGNITLRDYRAQLAKQKKDALELSSSLFEDESQNCVIREPVATTLLISLDQIRRNHSLAADCLFLTACIDRKDIPLNLLGAAALPRERDDAVRILDAYALVTRRPADSALDLHRLIHLAIRQWLQKQELLSQWTLEAIKHLVELFPDHDHGSRSKWRRLLPHAKYALSYHPIEQEDDARTDLVWKCAMALYTDGRYNEAGELFVRVMETRKTVFGEEHPHTLISMNNLASSYRNQGRWKEAEELDVRVTETSSRVLGEEHPGTLASMTNLASTYRNQYRWEEAEELSVRVMEISLRVLGEEHPNTLTSIGNLASTYRNQGRWKEAEELSLRVIEIRKRMLGKEHPDTLTSMDSLASTYWKQGRWKEAEELDIRVIETRKRVFGEEHPDTLTSMSNLASTYSSQGRWKESEELDMRALETRKTVLGEEHPETLTSMSNLAATYRNQGRWKEAEELSVRVIKMRKTVLGEEHSETLTSMSNLAATYRNQGRWKEAEELDVRVMETRKRVLGKEHPHALISMNNLASTYRNQGRWKEAEELSVRVMETRKRVLGEEHPDTLTIMNNLAFTRKGQGHNKEAAKLMDECVRLRTRVLGASHPSTLSSSEALRQWKLENLKIN
jgi:tetratricopeptide (TPR) repeat protein